MKDSQHDITISTDELIKLRFGNSDVRLMSNKKILSSVTGSYGSRFRGRGLEFQEVRAYQPGDDIRDMDWRVTARTGTPHPKIFEEAREEPVFLVVDNSASMHFGSRVTFKSVVAAKAAAILAWSAAANHDRVGGIVYSDSSFNELRPQGGSRGVLRLLKQISQTQCNSVATSGSQTSRLTDTFLHLRRVARPGSQLIILSDFFTLDDEAIRQTALLSRHNELVWIFIYDPLEAIPPLPGSYSISDGNEISTLNTRDERFNREYRARFRNKLDTITSTCRQYGIHFLSIMTNDDVASALRQGLSRLPRRKLT